MKTSQRKFSASFKAKVAIEVLRERETIQQIAARYEIHPTQVSSWKRQFLAGAQEAFGEHDGDEKKRLKAEMDQLYKEDWQAGNREGFLKKKSRRGLSVHTRRKMIDSQKHDLSASDQCRLFSIHRSGLYYKPRGESELNMQLMRIIDREFFDKPFYGVRRMTHHLKHMGYKVNRKRIERLYRLMDIRVIYPKKNLSKPGKGHKCYPYLLRDLKIDRPNQVWVTDITWIPMKKGFMYLIAIIDLHSRYVVNWSVSNSMDAAWCSEVLTEAIDEH